MPRKAAAPGPTSTTLYNSVTEWLGRMDAATAKLRDDGASFPFWLSWARDVLLSHGVDPSWPAVTVADILKLGAAASDKRSAAVSRVTSFRDAVPPESAEWYAATLEAESFRRGEEATFTGDYGSAGAERTAMLIGQMIAQIERERLKPYAEIGRMVSAGGRKGASVRKRERGLGRRGEVPKWINWLRANPVAGETHHAAAGRVSRHFGGSFETARKYLPKNFR